MKLNDLIKALRNAAKAASVENPTVNLFFHTPKGDFAVTPEQVFVCRDTVEIAASIAG